jgi:hypothetical protein
MKGKGVFGIFIHQTAGSGICCSIISNAQVRTCVLLLGCIYAECDCCLNHGGFITDKLAVRMVLMSIIMMDYEMDQTCS